MSRRLKPGRASVGGFVGAVEAAGGGADLNQEGDADVGVPGQHDTSLASSFQVNSAVVQNPCRRLCYVQAQTRWRHKPELDVLFLTHGPLARLPTDRVGDRGSVEVRWLANPATFGDGQGVLLCGRERQIWMPSASPLPDASAPGTTRSRHRE
jgi:hypothetical protein